MLWFKVPLIVVHRTETKACRSTVGAQQQQQQRSPAVPASPAAPQDRGIPQQRLRRMWQSDDSQQQGVPLPPTVQQQRPAPVLTLPASRIQAAALDSARLLWRPSALYDRHAIPATAPNSVQQACSQHHSTHSSSRCSRRAKHPVQNISSARKISKRSSMRLLSIIWQQQHSGSSNTELRRQQQHYHHHAASGSNYHGSSLTPKRGVTTLMRGHYQTTCPHGQALAPTAAQQQQQQQSLEAALAADQGGASAAADQRNQQAATQQQQHHVPQSHEQQYQQQQRQRQQQQHKQQHLAQQLHGEQQQPPHQEQQQSFAGIGVAPELVQVLQQQLHISSPTPVQVQAMRPVAAGRHVAVQSATGTGKTLAYLLPLMSLIKPWDPQARKHRHGRVIVLAPTQELCMQIVRTARSLIPADRQSVMGLVGGSNFAKALQSVSKHKPWLIVATPGRLSVVMNTPGLFKKVAPCALRIKSEGDELTLVLEEAPKLLAMDDTKQVLAKLAPRTPGSEEMSVMARVLQHYQVILVSASLKPSTLAAASAWAQADPVMITASAPTSGMAQGAHAPSSNTAAAAEVPGRPQMLPSTISHQVITYDHKRTRMEKMLLRCLTHYKHQGQKVLVFVGDKIKLAQIEQWLSVEAGSVKVCCVHGQLPSNKKADSIRRFNQGQYDALLLTDGFALGLDFEAVDVVMQVGSLPASPSQYTHRAGRCGRMERQGTVVSLVLADNIGQFNQIVKRLGIEVKEVVLATEQKGGASTPRISKTALAASTSDLSTRTVDHH